MLTKISFLLLAFFFGAASSQGCPSSWTCYPTTTPPTLDGNATEWSSVEGISTTLVDYNNSKVYGQGNATLKCMYDDTYIYFLFEIPGLYSWNETNSHESASIGTMSKIGTSASYYGMGGCPNATLGCPADLSVCDAYRVDLGAHWQLAYAPAGVKIEMNVSSGSGDDTSGLTNKDDEYGVSATCREDDDGSGAGNEWAGAWGHTNPMEGEEGVYVFEMTRLLSTKSTSTDVQYAPGETVEMGVAFWDPFHTATGWEDPDHWITGCGSNWIELELLSDGGSGGGGSSAPEKLLNFFQALLLMIGATMWFN